jgi:glycosyltransferase involved in cell wall biosynthesis
LKKREALLLVVGADDTSYSRKLGELPWVRLHGMIPLQELPGPLEAADVVIIPQRSGPVTRVQMPSKLFDAMAMARPIVATRVSDMGLVLGEGRGVTVPPGSVGALSRALERILESPALGRSMGERAREWCVAHASLRASREPMGRALGRALRRRIP